MVKEVTFLKVNHELDHEVTSNAQKVNSSTSVHNSKHVSFLPTAKVLLYNNEGKSFLYQALLNSG